MKKIKAAFLFIYSRDKFFKKHKRVRLNFIYDGGLLPEKREVFNEVIEGTISVVMDEIMLTYDDGLSERYTFDEFISHVINNGNYELI